MTLHTDKLCCTVTKILSVLQGSCRASFAHVFGKVSSKVVTCAARSLRSKRGKRYQTETTVHIPGALGSVAWAQQRKRRSHLRRQDVRELRRDHERPDWYQTLAVVDRWLTISSMYNVRLSPPSQEFQQGVWHVGQF